MDRVDVAIVGGGFSGAVFALHLLRAAPRTLRVAVVEPSAALGRGLAYGTADPDHRLNGPIEVHMVYPDRPGHLRDWFLSTGGLDHDPEAAAADGSLFIRRSTFGAYVGAELEAAAKNSGTSALIHIRDKAKRLMRTNGESGDRAGFRLMLEQGEALSADRVVVTASYEKPAVPAAFGGPVSSHPAFIADPWDSTRIDAIPAAAQVLVLGVAQTGSEIVASLLRRRRRVEGRAGAITALSRRGLRPVPRPPGALPPESSLFERIDRPTSLFAEAHGLTHSVAAILRVLRADIRRAVYDDGTWAEPFGVVRDSLWQLWPTLPLAEKRRFMRHLRRWYDAHRFQLPPQVEDCLTAGEAAGQVRYRAGTVVAAQAEDEAIAVTLRARGEEAATPAVFDAVINCTGPAAHPARSGNPFLTVLVDDGLAAPHGTGIGFDVNAQNRAINAAGAPEPGLYVVGPLTYGAFADQQSAAFIASRVQQIMPEFVRGYAASPA